MVGAQHFDNNGKVKRAKESKGSWPTERHGNDDSGEYWRPEVWLMSKVHMNINI